MLFRDWVPSEFFRGEYEDTPAMRLLDAEVMITYKHHERLWCFTPHRNVMNWCIVQKGERYYAVGWNENPTRGWSFPMKWIRSAHPTWIKQIQEQKSLDTP